jgi:shikimate kinase
MNLILIGYRCSGKTSVGKIIAGRTGMSFYDTDDLIEKHAGRTIEEIVAEKGWVKFREMEKVVIKDASEFNDAVIATGGGVVMTEDNVVNLKKNGYVVWFDSDPEILMKRMEKDNAEGRGRPSLTGSDPVEETKKMLEMRNPLYFAAADVVIITDKLSPDEVAEKALEAFNARPLKFS